jgi:hypothetical protein
VGSFSNDRCYKSMIQQSIWNLRHSNLAMAVAYDIASRCTMVVVPYNNIICCRSEPHRKEPLIRQVFKGEKQKVFLEPAAPELCKTPQQICIKFIHIHKYFNGRLSTIRRQNDHLYVRSISTTGWTIANLRRRDCSQEHDLTFTSYLRFDLTFSFLVKSYSEDCVNEWY